MLQRLVKPTRSTAVIPIDPSAHSRVTMPMLKKKLLAGVAAFLVSFIVTALLAATLAELRNEFFECCATKAFGWPFPWWVNGCRPAEGTLHAYRLGNVAVYLLVGGIASCGLYRAFIRD